MRELAIAFSMLSAALFAWVLGSEGDEIAMRDLFVFTTALVIIVAVQLLVLFAVYRVVGRDFTGRGKYVPLAVAAVLMALNAYFFAFSILERPLGVRIAVAALFGVVFLALTVFRPARVVLALFAGIMIVMSLVQYVSTRSVFAGRDVTAETVSVPVNSKRNVYLLGSESLHSPKAYREHYGIEDPEHLKVLRDAGFRVLDSAYSAERSTVISYASILEFVRPRGGDELGARTVFINDNSTFRSFRDSGYNIQFVYISNYFAVNRNNVNYAYPPLNFDACDELERHYFYGLCSHGIVRMINKYIFRSPRVTYREQVGHLKDRADYVLKTSRPWLTITHVKYPFHTHGYFSYPNEAYTAKFTQMVRNAMPTVAQNIRNTAAYITQQDPNAVVIVFGDHGTHLFRGVKKEQVFTEKPILPVEKVLLDQHGVMFAVYPANFCVNRMREGFSTMAMIENLIACLNGNDNPTEDEQRRARTVNFFYERHDVEKFTRAK
jgi:hypothetical protein